MDELVKINYENQRPTVLGRDLHEALEVKTAYKDWFPRMCEYGFEEGSDFSSFLSESTGGRPSIDHQLTIDMAKELCMIQRTPKGKECRQYFLEIERRWNSPEAIMARALQFANQQIAEMKPKVSYYDVVLNCKDLISTSAIAKDYGKSAIWMNRYLNKKGIQFKQGGIWLLYQKYAEKGYTSTKTHSYLGSNGQQHTKVHTYWTQKGRLFIYELMKADGILPQIEMEGA